MKKKGAVILCGLLGLFIYFSCSKNPVHPNTGEFDQAVRTRGTLPQSEEYPETPVGSPTKKEEGTRSCTYQEMKAAAGHNEFLPSFPYSGMYPAQMYYLPSFDDGGLKIFPARLKPVTLSWDLTNSTGPIVQTMDTPSTSQYRQSQQTVLSNALNGVTPARIEYEYKQIFQTSQIDLEVDASFSGFGAKFKNMFDFNGRQRQSFVWVEFTQIYYTVEMDIKAEKPSDWFVNPNASDLIEDGSIVYVYGEKYGRRLILAFSSNYEFSRVKDVLEASYNGIVAGGGIRLNVQQMETFAGTEIKAFVLGGGAEPAISVITNPQKLEEYMRAGANFSKESPGELIGFTLRYLSDNSIARHVSTASYLKRDCVEIPVEPITITVNPSISIWGSPAIRQWGHDDWDTGPVIRGGVSLVSSNNVISANIKVEFIDGVDYKPNCYPYPNRNTNCPAHTYALAQTNIALYSIPSNYSFVKVEGDTEAKIVQFFDSNETVDQLQFTNGNFIQRIEAQGNTDGPDLPGGGWGYHPNGTPHDRSWVSVSFKPIKVMVRRK